MFNTSKIEELRKLKKLSQRELAEKIDMTTKGFQLAVYNNDFKASVLAKIAGVLGVSVSYFFEEQTESKSMNNVGNFKNNNVISNSNSSTINAEKKDKGLEVKVEDLELQIEELESKNEYLASKNDDLTKTNLFYWNMNAGMIDNITTLLVRIVEENKKMLHFIDEQNETRRFIAQINTLEGLTDRKVLFNKRFFKYFKNPYI